MNGPDRPDIPYPFPPLRDPPRRTDPILVPTVTIPAGDPYQRLFDQRTVMVSGPLDHDAASRLCAELMALDGESARDVTLVVNSTGGPVEEVPAVLDVLALMRAPVNATCVGTAQGTAGAVLACATGRRRAAPNATISIRCDQPVSASGVADELGRRVAEHETQRRRLRDALAAATGQPAEVIAAELDGGGVHDAAGALALGLVDEAAASMR